MKKLIPPLAVRLSLSFLSALLIVTLLFAFEQPAYAYVDPGSSFVFLQVIGSMAAGALFYLRHRIRKLFRLTSRADQQISSAETGATEPHA